MTVDLRALFERYVSALNRRDSEHLDGLLTEDVVIEYPQSGEVIRGLHNLRALIEHNPAGPPGADPSTARAQGSSPSSVSRAEGLRVAPPYAFSIRTVQPGG